MPDDTRMSRAERWRLVLGEAGHETMDGEPLSKTGRVMDAALAWLYEQQDELTSRSIRPTLGGDGGSILDVPTWLHEIHRLFPRSAVETMERDAVERYQILEVLTSEDALRQVKPSMAMVHAILKTKHLMRPAVLRLARALVADVVRELEQRLRLTLGDLIQARPARDSTPLAGRRLHLARTLRENLAGYDAERRRVVVRRPWFYKKTRNHRSKQVVILVDQSGSMVDSVIHAAVMASVLWTAPMFSAHLVLFDTQVVDMTDHCHDPVDLLLGMQLGGGTHIGPALAYGAQLIAAPRDAIVVLISDLFDGGTGSVRRVEALCQQGTQVVVLAALDHEAQPFFDRAMAQRLTEVGAQVSAMTPDHLARWLCEQLS